MPPEDKDAALFPRRFDGRWAMIHRPSPLRGGAHMWISFSPDLRHWGDHTLLLEARDGAWWDAGKIGLGPPPLETPEGWLAAATTASTPTAAGPIYRVGLALLDLENPRIVLRPDRRVGLRADRRRTRSPATSARSSSPAAGSSTRRGRASASTTAAVTRSSGWPRLRLEDLLACVRPGTGAQPAVTSAIVDVR